MFRAGINRQLLRSSRQFVRCESSTTAKATEKAAELGGKAQEQAKAAAGKAGAALSGMASSASSGLGRLGGVQEPVVYWSKVVGQLAKQVYLKEGMSPPNVAQVESVYKQLYKGITTGELANSFRALSTKELVKLGADGIVIYVSPLRLHTDPSSKAACRGASRVNPAADTQCATGILHGRRDDRPQTSGRLLCLSESRAGMRSRLFNLLSRSGIDIDYRRLLRGTPAKRHDQTCSRHCCRCGFACHAGYVTCLDVSRVFPGSGCSIFTDHF